MNSVFDHDEFEETDRPDEPTFTWDLTTAVACLVVVILGLGLVCAITG